MSVTRYAIVTINGDWQARGSNGDRWSSLCNDCGNPVSSYRMGCPGCGAPVCCQRCCDEEDALAAGGKENT